MYTHRSLSFRPPPGRRPAGPRAGRRSGAAPGLCRRWPGAQRGGRRRGRRNHSSLPVPPAPPRKVRCPLPVSGEAENTPPGPGSDEADPQQEEGFVRGEAENGSLPTLFAAKTVQTWMDVGATLDRAQAPRLRNQERPLSDRLGQPARLVLLPGERK